MSYKRKEDRQAFAKAHYQKNKDLYKQRASDHNQKARQRNKEYILNHLKLHPCVDCNESDPIILEFDHISGTKLNTICDMRRNSCSIKTIQEEIDKCEVRCANCHRRITHKRRQLA